MWIIQEEKQKIFFIDPKGLVHIDQEKIDFHKKIKEIESKIKREYPEENIELNAFIVTETNIGNIGDKQIRQNPTDHGVYFFDDANYLHNMLT